MATQLKDELERLAAMSETALEEEAKGGSQGRQPYRHG